MIPKPHHNLSQLNRRRLVPVILVIGGEKASPRISPSMAGNALVIIDRPEVVAPGLKLGNWSQVDAEKAAVQS